MNGMEIQEKTNEATHNIHFHGIYAAYFLTTGN